VSPPSPSAPVDTEPHFRLGYRAELDGVRGLSILLVLGLHFTPRLLPGGYFGVEVFFVLSGFLITSLLLEEVAQRGSISLKDFYRRRALRLGPALAFYLLSLGAYAFFVLKSQNAREIYSGILLTLSYVSNWVIAFKPHYPAGILAITWSLAVEEQFYLLWPLLLVLLIHIKVGRRWIISILLLGLVALVLHRAWLWHQGASFRRLYYATDTRADGLILGCLLGCLVVWRLIPKSRTLEIGMKVLAVVSSLLLGYYVFTIKSNSPILFSGVFLSASVAIAIVIAVLVVWPSALALMAFRFPPLLWIGRISYGLYLWHWPVRGLVFGNATEPSFRQIMIAVAMSFAIAAFSFYLIERPFLRLKKRFSHA
jgi:peptidoglycan/LPS O-acetylase OafA/YrhL